MPEDNWKTLQGSFNALWPQVLKLLIQMIGIITLARILTPDQFGISAIFFIVANFIDLLRDRGLSVCALQKQDFTRNEQVRTFWLWINSALLLSVFVSIIFCALFILTNQKYLIVFCFLVPLYLLLNCLQTMLQILMIKSGRFLEIGISEVAGQFLGLSVGLVVAIKTDSYLALLAQIIVAQTFTVLLRYLRLKWGPGKFQIILRDNSEPQENNKIMLSQIISYLANNLDSVLILGKFGLVQGGIYNRLSTITVNSASQILSPLSSVFISRLVRVRHNSRDFQALQYMIYCGLVLLIVLSISIVIPNGALILSFILGSSWDFESNVFNFLCVTVLFQGCSLFNYCYMVAIKANLQILRVSYISKGISLLVLIIGINFGMAGIALSLAVSALITWVLGLIVMVGFSRIVFIEYVLPVFLSLSGLYLGMKLGTLKLPGFHLPDMIEYIIKTILISTLAIFPLLAIKSVRKVFASWKS